MRKVRDPQRHQLNALIAWHRRLHHGCDSASGSAHARFAGAIKTNARYFMLLAICGTSGVWVNQNELQIFEKIKAANTREQIEAWGVGSYRMSHFSE